MKSKMLLALAGFLIVSMLFISPVSAQRVTYRAVGILYTYADAWTSEIVDGSWSVEIRGDLVKFKAFYRELNKDVWENSPVGTIDTFIITLTDYSSVTFTDGECIIWDAELDVRKIWWNLDTEKPEPIPISLFPLSITIDESNIVIDLEPAEPGGWLGQDFDIIGSTLSISYV